MENGSVDILARRLLALKEDLAVRLGQLPPGELVRKQNGKYVKYFQDDHRARHYIPKNNPALRQALAEKAKLAIQLTSVIDRLACLDNYCRICKQEQMQMADLQQQYPFAFASDAATAWQRTAYEMCPYHPELKVHSAPGGLMVRSKSEVMIAQYLWQYGIPFRYEAALSLGGAIVYPDFTVRHPTTGQFYYWEHFGMMDDPAYSGRAFGKMARYAAHGILPAAQFIATYETKAMPLSVDTIEEVVLKYFL